MLQKLKFDLQISKNKLLLYIIAQNNVTKFE